MLSEDLRNELATIAPRRGCCRLAEVSALFHSAGSIHLRGRGEVGLHLDLVSSAVARRAFTLLRELGIHSEIRTYRRRSFDRATRYQLHVEGDEGALATLVEAGVLDSRRAPLERPPRRVVGRACCRGAYLRGALLGGGSLSGPRSPHLELRTTSLDGAEFLRSVAAAGDVTVAVLDRGRHAVAYAKGFDA
ncbi:MAG TPA: DNA-binding protein WhiA, partial [Gaiellaceae bacterium]|nr:DNA-binding protein WhiA [Gaiellaceae bacterium]